MNKSIYILMAIAFFFSSCSNDVLEETTCESDDFFGDIRTVTLTDGNKSGGITMLEFASIDHYESTIEALELLVEQHDDEFMATYSNLKDDELERKEEEIGFLEAQPLIDFEDLYNIPSSMRQVYEKAEEKWLDNEELDPTQDPSLKYCFGLEEMTLLNSNGEVKIGDFILKLTKDGFIKIDSLDVETLIRINDGDSSALFEPTVTTNLDLGGKSKGDCKAWKPKNYWDDYANKKKVKLHVHFHAYPWKGTSQAKIVSYKKNWNNKWKKHRMNLGVANQSYFRDRDCNGSVSEWSGWKRKKRKRLKKNVADWGAFPGYRAENGQSVFGYFEYAGNSKIKPLVW